MIEPLDADSDKYTRAVPAAKRMQTQILFAPAVHWWDTFTDELLAFPHAAHDDMVDVLSYAHRVRGTIWVPREGVPAKTPAPPVDVVQASVNTAG